MRETAYAKINLALHVRRRRDDGYHDLETVYAFAEDGDELTAEIGADLSLTISGRFAQGLSNGEDNLALRAARALQAVFGTNEGAHLHLEKNLPVASGIGGGSANAAAVLRLLSRLWNLDLGDARFMAIAAALGADVPACIASVPVIGTGRGDQLTPYNGVENGIPVLLVNPLVPLSTAQVFAGWDGKDRGALDVELQSSWRNDLTGPAIALAPVIARHLARLERCEGARLAQMSGSGATCFAVFDNEDARDAAIGQFANCWTLPTRFR
jgi:4-diphosphocytidyl-2-C-methyl-D-erythritol kinase